MALGDRMKRKCVAHSKRTGEPCKRYAVTGYSVCPVHGAGHPGKGRPGAVGKFAYRGGRYSNYLPTRLLEMYDQAKEDPELLSLRDELAITDARLADLLQRADKGESGHFIEKISDQIEILNQALRGGDPNALAAAMQDLNVLIKRGKNDYAIWHDISDLIYQRRALVDQEQKRLVNMQQMISAEQAMALITSVIGVIKDNVSDQQTLQAISFGIGRLIAAHSTDAANG